MEQTNSNQQPAKRRPQNSNTNNNAGRPSGQPRPFNGGQPRGQRPNPNQQRPRQPQPGAKAPQQQQPQVMDARKANQTTREPKIRVIPLGGLGEVGKNMMAIEYGNDIIVVDMGFAFPNESQPGIDYIIPDVTYLEKNKHKIRGHIITHGHMDHIGAAGYILPKLPAPIFGTRLSLAMLEKQVEEFRLQVQPQLRVLDPDKHEKVQLGVFRIELVRVTHSIPDATAVVIETPVGTIINTGDWRLDPDPIDGRHMDLKRFGELGEKGVLLLMSDSTRCEAVGRTPSERVVAPTLDDLFGRTPGRIVVSTFASSLMRVQLIVDAAQKTGRKLAFNGRSMLANVELAVKLGYLKVPAGLIMRMQEIVRQPDNQVVVLCTGSQGEVNSALTRMSTGDHPHFKIKPGDTVIMSSSPIPGNEKAVVTTVDLLMREGAKVYQNTTRELDDCGPLHVSGHASRDDIVDLLKLVKPKFFMPIHGEFHMQVRHAELAVKTGMSPNNVFVIDNGDVLEVMPDKARKGESVPSGAILIDGSASDGVEGVVLRDRLAMASDGVFVIVATLDRKTGKLVTSPDIISRGFVYMKENEELISRARGEVRKAFERRNTKEPTDWQKFKLKLRDDISNYLYGKTKRNPMVIPVINEV